MDANNNFIDILDEEEKVLDSMTEKQKLLRASVTEKNWESLLSIISEINLLSDLFQKIDAERDVIQSNATTKELKPYFEQLGRLRSKLLKCKLENKALGEYVNTACGFIKEFVEKALPQSRSRVYSRNGQIVQPQPQSVVVNMSF